MMSCIDNSCDRQIQQTEFLRFFFIVWSTRLMQVQEYLNVNEVEFHNHTQSKEFENDYTTLKQRRLQLRKALRQNFSRPFRDAMRCATVQIPGPFEGLLNKFHLLPKSEATTGTLGLESESVQVWQVLKGSKIKSSNGTEEFTTQKAKSKSLSGEICWQMHVNCFMC